MKPHTALDQTQLVNGGGRWASLGGVRVDVRDGTAAPADQGRWASLGGV